MTKQIETITEYAEFATGIHGRKKRGQLEAELTISDNRSLIITFPTEFCRKYPRLYSLLHRKNKSPHRFAISICETTGVLLDQSSYFFQLNTEEAYYIRTSLIRCPTGWMLDEMSERLTATEEQLAELISLLCIVIFLKKEVSELLDFTLNAVPV